MSAFSWRHRSRLPASRSESRHCAARGSASREHALPSPNFDSSAANSPRGGRSNFRSLCRAAATPLLGLTLLAGFAADAHADGILTISAPNAAPSTRSAIAEGNSGMRDLIFQVRLTNAVSAQVPFEVCFSGSATRGPTLSDDYQTLLGTSPQTTACVSSFIAAGHTAPSSAQTVGIRVVGDLLFEFDETVIATLSLGPNPPWDAGLGTRTATHTILEDDTEVEFGESTIVGREGGRARIPVVLASKLPHSATIRFQYGGSATKWTDYDASNTSLTFRRGQTGRDLYINLPDDSDFDDNENVVVRLDTGSLPAGIQAGSTTQTTVTIKDNDYTIMADLADNPREDGGGASIKVTIDPPQDRPVGVGVGFSDISATGGVDYLQEHHSFPNGVVTFRALQAREWIYIPIVNDGAGDGETNELFTVTLTQKDGAVQSTSVNPVIKQLQPGERASRLRIAVDGSDTVPEGQIARFKLTMDRPVESNSTVAVGLAQKSDDGARSKWLAAPTTHAHYVTVEFARGESEQTLSFTIANDGRDTNGSIEAVLMQPGLHPASSGPFSLYSGATSSAKVQIRDGSDGLRSPSTAPAVEIPDTQVANVQASAIDDASATVTWDAVEHATSYEVDWEGESADQQVYLSGVVPGITGTTTTIQHDAPEALTLAIKVIPAYVDGNGDTQLLNDLAGATTLDVGPAGGGQDGAPLSACVSDAQWNTVEGYYASNSGKAPNYGENWYRVLIAYAQERTDETLPDWAGATARPTTPYTVAEARESETVWSGWTPVREVLACVEAAYPPPAPLQASEPELSLSAGPDVDEGDGATFTVHADPAPQSDLTVRFTVAQSGDWLDAPGAGSRTVTLPAGAASANLTVATVDDGADEDDGWVSVAIDTGTGYTVAAAPNDAASVTVRDDDAPPPVTPSSTMGACVSDAQWNTVEDYYASNSGKAPNYGRNWYRVLIAYGQARTDKTLPDWAGVTARPTTPYTVADAQASETVWSGWTPVREVLECVEAANPPPAPPQTPDPEPDIRITGGDAVTEGDAATFTLTATPAPAGAITVSVEVVDSGDFANSGQAGSRTVNIGTDGSGTLTVTTDDDNTDETDGTLTATVAGGPGYTPSGAQGSASVTVNDDDDPAPTTPVVSITGGDAVTEGGAATFTLTATPPPASTITVSVEVVDSGDFANSGQAGSRTVDIGTDGTGTLAVTTDDDSVDETDGSLTATVTGTQGYTVAASPDDTAAVAVADDDAAAVVDNDVPAGAPTLSVLDAEADESDWFMRFTVQLSHLPPELRSVGFLFQTRESTPVSAREGKDYKHTHGTRRFRQGDPLTMEIKVYTYDDKHNDPNETFELVISHPTGAAIADAVGVGTIRNSDPLPTAFLGRFGRGLAEQAVSGITARLHANRTQGFSGQFLGQALGAGHGTAAGTPNRQPPALTQDRAPTLAVNGTGMAGVGMAGTDRGMGMNGTGRATLSGQDSLFPADSVTGHAPPATATRTVTLAEALAGSAFTYTREADEAGGSFGLWGRGMHSTFSGSEGALNVDGELTTGLIGADYARQDWQAGLAVLLTGGEGSFRGTTGKGTLDTSLTAFVPYAARQAGRLEVWGAAGYGFGEMTLSETVSEANSTESLSTDLGWQLAAGGVRSNLGTFLGEWGPELALLGDAQWTRTTSAKTLGLAESEAQTTRVRVGVEGGWSLLLGEQSLRPTIEAGVRYDGGDADTGLGIELGAGLSWEQTRWGLAVDIEGRTLVAHEDKSFKHSGFSASLTFDPDLTSLLGPSLTLTHRLGGPSSGGLDALFAEQLPGSQSGHNAGGHWQAEAAYGMEVFRGRFIGTPTLGYTLSGQAGGYRLGWQLSPARTDRLHLSAEVAATRNELPGAAADHGIGLNLSSQW